MIYYVRSSHYDSYDKVLNRSKKLKGKTKFTISGYLSYFLATLYNLCRIIKIKAIPTRSLKGSGSDKFGQ